MKSFKQYLMEKFPSTSDYKDRGTGKFDKKKDPTTGGTIHSVKYDNKTGETEYKKSRGQHHQDQEILHVDTKPLSKVWNKRHMKEDGAMASAPVNSVAGVAGTGDSRLPASQREPGVSKKRNPTLGYFRRKPPKV